MSAALQLLNENGIVRTHTGIHEPEIPPKASVLPPIEARTVQVTACMLGVNQGELGGRGTERLKDGTGAMNLPSSSSPESWLPSSPDIIRNKNQDENMQICASGTVEIAMIVGYQSWYDCEEWWQ